MADIETVRDADDPRLRDYVSLRDVQLRQHLEAEHGFFIAEGEKVVRRAVAAGYQPRSFLLAERWIEGLTAELDAAAGVPCYVVAEDVAEAVTGFHVHRGALAALHRQPLPAVDDVIAGASRIVLLEDVVDHANVGSVMRNAAALGIDAVLLSPRCADPLYRRAVKVSMGAVFSLPWTRVPDWYDAVPMLSRSGFSTVALTPDSTPGSLEDLVKTPEMPRLCLILGTEGAGLSQRWLRSADQRLGIEMSGGIDSLNIAAAAAIAFYATRRTDDKGVQ